LGPSGAPKGFSVRLTAAVFILWRPYGRDAKSYVEKARFFGDVSTVYRPEAPLCPPLCQTPAKNPVPWPRRCLVVALWWPGRALGLRCGLLKVKSTRLSGISMCVFLEILKNRYRIRFIHVILLQKKVPNLCFQAFFFSIPPIFGDFGGNTEPRMPLAIGHDL